MKLPGPAFRFRMLLLAAVAAAAGAAAEMKEEVWPPPGAGARPVPPRQPKYPLKDRPMLLSRAEIEQARANCDRYPAAGRLKETIVAAAAPWLDRTDEAIAALITPASVPRAFDVSSSAGCPKCGAEIHRKFGVYPWLVDPEKPFKLTCPVDGSVYPSNDYETYFRSGFKEKRGWDTAHVDDGWGWKSPSGERYWFVAHYNHRIWLDYVGRGVRTLAQAYLLTGDRRYAHKAAWMLYHTASVYPAMDHERQSRYGLMQAARGERYPGKIVNHIWESTLVTGFAQAYDAIWDSIDSDDALKKQTGKNGAEIRAHIEANLLEDAIDAYFAEKIRGNFGMHQSALAHLALARQHGDTEKWMGELLNRTGPSELHTGLNYALYNLVYRDGVPFETAPGYNFIWASKVAELAGLLKKSGRDLLAHPRTRLLFDGPLDIINIRKFTPSLGDSGGVYGGLVGQDVDVYQAALRQFGDPRYARFLSLFDAVGEKGFQTFNSLFHPPVSAPSGKLLAQQSRVLDGYGLGILNDPSDSTSLSLYYGYKGGHGHFDRLGLELFAGEHPMMPDLGYPDAMNAFVPGIYTWSKNTISHNTVTVDASRQIVNQPGKVELFAASSFARVLDVDATGVYPQTSRYRRAVFMVDTDGVSGKGSYFLDLFDVKGGSQHDYSLHGPPGEFAMNGGEWSAPAAGTLAGEKVEIGEIYDDPAMAQPGYSGGFTSYQGSGFQHLFNVRRHLAGDWVAEWRHEKKNSARLRIRILPAEGQQVLLAQAQISPVKQPKILQYLIARRKGKEVSSRFVSVLEPYGSRNLLSSAERLTPDGGSGLLVKVVREDGRTDWLIYDPEGTRKRFRRLALLTDARAALVTTGPSGDLERVFFAGGSFLNAGSKKYRASGLEGRVVEVDCTGRTIHVAPDAGSKYDPQSLAGRLAHFRNSLRRTAHPLVSARRSGGRLLLTTRDDLLVGRSRLKEARKESLLLDTPLPLGPVYTGAAVAGEKFDFFGRVAGVEESTLRLASPLRGGAQAAAPGRDLWIVNVAPGDRLELPALFSWRDPKSRR